MKDERIENIIDYVENNMNGFGIKISSIARAVGTSNKFVYEIIEEVEEKNEEVRIIKKSNQNSDRVITTSEVDIKL